VEIREGSETALAINTTISLDFVVCSLYFVIHVVIGFMYTLTVALNIFLDKNKIKT